MQPMNDNEMEQHYESLLDQYFIPRSPLPGGADGKTRMLPEPKTTDDIQYDLTEMLPIPTPFIYTYLVRHGYGLITRPDGTVMWAIWRRTGEE